MQCNVCKEYSHASNLDLNGVCHSCSEKELTYEEVLAAKVPPKSYDRVTQEWKEFTDIPSEFENNVSEILSELKSMLISKNKKYGNSALEPKRIFSSANATEQIKVRIDDKLSRMSNQDEDEDVVEDLLGYLVLLKIAEKDRINGK